jgi:hypothetical protein
MKQFLQIIILLVLASIPILAQETIDRKTVTEKYDEVSRLETMSERQDFFRKQTAEMKAALWQENIDRKTSGIVLSAEQKEILDVMRNKFLTAEFFTIPADKRDANTMQEFKETQAKAMQLFGKELTGELLAVLGDRKTLKKQ